MNGSTFHKILLSIPVLMYVNSSFSKYLELFRIIDSSKTFRTDPSITVLIQKGPCKSSLRRWYNIIYVPYHPRKLEVARFPNYGRNKERSWKVLHGLTNYMPLRARNREAPAKLRFALIQTLKKYQLIIKRLQHGSHLYYTSEK